MRASFRVVAAADPQAVPRLLNFFAQLDLLPERIEAVVANAELRVRIVIPEMRIAQAEIIAEKMRQGVLIEHVILRVDRK